MPRVRRVRTRWHGGEVIDGEPAAQMSCGLHQREEGRAGVVSGKLMAVVAHRDGGAMWGSRVDSTRRRRPATMSCGTGEPRER
jgi:hypothetical protein